MKICHFCIGIRREHYEASRDRETKEKRSLPMHESRNVDTSEKNAPSKIEIKYSIFDLKE